jgi:hypothetical protein
MIKVVELKELDGIIEESDMDLGKGYSKEETQNIDLGPQETDPMSEALPKQVSTTKSFGMIKVVELKELDDIIEESDMDLGKGYSKEETQNIDLGPHETNPMRKAS